MTGQDAEAGVLPRGLDVLPTYGARHLLKLCKINKMVLFLSYRILYKENLWIPRIRQAFDCKSVSKSLTQLLLRYEPEFLRRAPFPTSPYQRFMTSNVLLRQGSDHNVDFHHHLWNHPWHQMYAILFPPLLTLSLTRDYNLRPILMLS